MPRLKAEQLREMDPTELLKRLSDLRGELVRLTSAAERGTIQKESGKIRPLRREIARIETVLTEKRREGSGVG